MRRHYFLEQMNLDTLSVTKAEKLTHFSTRVKGKDAVASILFARILEIRDAFSLSPVGGNSCSPALARAVPHSAYWMRVKKRDAVRAASLQSNGPGRTRTSDLTLVRHPRLLANWPTNPWLYAIYRKRRALQIVASYRVFWPIFAACQCQTGSKPVVR